MENTSPKLKEEFATFLNSHAKPPQSLSDRLQARLHPSWMQVFSKLLIVQLIVGGLTLLFCPQFGIAPLGGDSSFLTFLLKQGQFFCAAACGMIFIGTSAIASLFVLNPEESAQLKKHSVTLIGALATIALFILLGISRGLEITTHHSGAYFSSIWWIAALLSSLLFIQAGTWLKRLKTNPL